MKKVLCSILAFVFVIGIFFSAPITIEAFAVENEVVEKNTNLILPDVKTGIYRYQLTVDGSGYILHGPVINNETGAMHESITGDITLPTVHPDDGKPIVELADNAFKYAGGITSVTIPGCYQKIGAYVFCDTPSLTSVTLQENVEEIGMYAFSDCSNLVNVTFPDSVTKVGEGVLSETAYNGLDDSWQFNNNWVNGLLYTGDILIEGVEHFFSSKVISLLPETRVIASKAFYRYYASAEGIIIPETVDYIGDYAIGFVNDPLTNEPKLINDFVIYGLPNTVAQTYAEENGITFSEIDMEDCFQYRLNEDGTGYIVSNLVSYDKFELIFPSEHNGYPVVGIGSYIIGTNSLVRSVTIPDTITTIEYGAFYGAENLKEINNLHDNLEIGGNAFYGTAFYNDQSKWENGTLYLGNYLVSCDMNYQGEFVVKDGTKGILADAFNCRSGITSVILPDSVEYIGDQAFYGCENLVSVTLGSNFRKVGVRAFSNCYALKNITNTTNITQIGDSAFSGCGLLESFVFSNKLEVIPTYAFSPCGLTSISIPDSVKTIGYGAFSNCSAQSISIGQGVKTIGEEAFRNCSVESITIPASVEEIGENAFLFDSLKEIDVAEDNAFYCDVNGVLYNKSKTECIFTPVGYTGVFEIGSDLTTIPTNLFDNRNFITNITVVDNPNFIIEDGVLYNEDKTKLIFCLKNKSGDFVVPETVTTIGESAFKNCTKLTGVTLPDGLEYIENNAFYGTKLTNISIPNTVETIGNSAFADNTVLSEITLPTSLQKISEKTFSGCTALGSIEIPDTVTVIEREAFLSTNLESIDFPKNLKIIGERAFSCINTLNAVVFPDSIEIIENNAFSECSNLESVTIKSGNIWSGVFFNCSKLSSVVLQDGVKEIYSGVFENCTSIKSITIPESVSIIGSPFGGCTGLTSVTVGATFVCDAAFSGCSNLYDITIEDTVVDIHSTSLSGTDFYNDDSNWNDDGSLILDGYLLVPENNIDFSKTYEFKSDIKGFARDIFQRNGDVGLTSVVIPGTIKHIPSTAFDGCWLESMVIEEGVETIGNSAVGHLSGNIYVPSTVTKISDGAFRSQGIGSIEVSPDNKNYVSVDGVVYTKDMKTLVAYPVGRGNHYDMPDTVESIRPGALEFMHSSITFSDKITELSPFMFSYSCAERFVIPSGITEIPEYCFANNTYLKEIVLPSTITKIANNAFENCSSLETIILPENLEYIGNNVFYGCSSLNDVNLADTKVTKIGESCFENCLSLESIIMPETLEEIPSRCFAACAKLNGVIFSNVSTIAPSAFFGCTSLLNAVVPETVDEIGEMALGYGGNTTAQPATYSVRMLTPKRYNSANSTSATAYSARTMSSEPKKPEVQVEDFAIYGEVGSEAEKYAKANDFEFHDSTKEHVCVAGNWQYTVEPTCTTSGEKYKKCVTCGETMEEKVAEPTDHLFTGWVNTTESTCSKQGENTKYCVNCGYSETQPASTKAHRYNESDICADCGINKSELVVLKPYDNNLDEIKVYHKDGANRIAITFSADTYIQNNDYVYIYAEEKNENQTYGDFTNNNFEDTSIVTYKNYYQVEYLQNKRLFVHDTDTVVVRLVTDGNTEESTEPNFEIVNVEYFTDECSHENKKTVGAYSAIDCGSPGHTGKEICANNDCQKVFNEGQSIDLPHTVTNWTVQNEATCSSSGRKTGVCDVCGCYAYETIDVLSHNFTEWEKQSEPTCMNYGTLYRKCTNNNCGYQEWDSSSLTPVGHSYGEWIISWEPTCENNGYKYRYCIYDCGLVQEEWPEATDHQGEWVITESTCTSSGKKVFDCTVDGCDYYTEEKIQKLPHNFGEDGLCTSCGKSETECIETPDPYTESAEFKIYKENATRIKITFSEDTELYWGDYIYIYDEEATGDRYYNDIDDMGDINYVACGYRDSLAGKSLVVESDTIIIRLVVMDENYENCRGFALTNVEYFYDECNHAGTKVINQKEATCTEKSYSGDTVCANDSCLKLIEAGTYGASLGHNFDGNTCSRCGTGMWSYYFYDDMEDEPSEIVINGYLGDETEITIPSEINGYKVVGIASNAFSYKEDIKTVIIPEGVTYIGYGAFEYCEQLENVTISSTVKSIERYAFYGCNKLNVEIVSGNPYFTVEDNIIFNKDKTEINYVVNCDDVVFEVPNGVTKITSGCFNGMDKTKTIVIPATVEIIDNSVFEHCSIPLKNIVVSKDNKNYSSKDGVLYNKNGTTLICCPKNNTSSLYIPNGVKTIESNAISGDFVKFVSIPNSVETIENNAFSNCYNLTSFVIGTGLKIIGDGVFCSMWNGEGESIHVVYAGSEAQWNAIEKGEENYDLNNSKIHYNSTETILGNWSSVEQGDGCDSVSTNRTCECGFNQYDWVSGEHCYGETTTVIASTCVDNGIATKTCAECEVVECVILPLAEHKSVNVGTVGIHTKCSVCGVTTSTKHTYKETIQDSTCTAKGVKTFTCDCGYSYTVDVDKKAHTPINGGEKGIHSKCKDCGATLSTQHTYSRSETKATCEKAGTVKFSCSCGYYYTETTKATGHNSNTKITGKAATCTATGLTEGAKCSVCGKVTVEQKEIAKLSHNQNTKIAGKAATCTATGLTEGTKCSVCGTVTKAQQVIPATGHNQNTKIPAVAATCTKAGLTEGAKCSVCGTVTKAQQTIAATGHKITVVNKKDATTKEAGYTGDKVCSVCNAVTEKGTVIPKIIVSLATPNVAIKNTAKGIEVSWNAIENAQSYVIYRRVYDATTKKWSGWNKLKTGHTSTSYVDGTVVLGTGYRYTVRAVNGDIMSAYTSTSTLKYNVIPTVKVANTGNGIKVTWSTVANATGYTVYSSTYNTKTKKWSNWSNRGTAKATSTSWVDKKASSGVQYKYTVRACNGANIKSSYKASANLIYLAQPTVKIANASNGVKVSWNKIAGATSYYVYSAQFNPTTNKWSNWTNRGSVTTTSWTDTAVQSGVTYRYTVRAINGKTLSSYKATAGLIYLAQPTVKIANASIGVRVSWSQSAGASGYTVYRAELVNGKWSNWKNMGTAKAEKSSWVDKSAKSGTKYKYTVRAVNGSVRSTYKATGELLYLAQPTVTVKAVSNGINVAWTQCTGAKGYTVYRSELVNGKWSNWKNMGTAKAEKSSWVDKSATAGVTYRYTVRAVNGKVRSTYVASTNVNR